MAVHLHIWLISHFALFENCTHSPNCVINACVNVRVLVCRWDTRYSTDTLCIFANSLPWQWKTMHCRRLDERNVFGILVPERYVYVCILPLLPTVYQSKNSIGMRVCLKKSYFLSHNIFYNFSLYILVCFFGYWRQRADDRHGNPPQGNQEL